MSMRPTETIRLGVISDTHGLLREEAVGALRGVDRILHAGDVGDPEILATLGAMAPVTAVRGNMDAGAWARELPGTEVAEVGGLALYMLHDLDELDLDPGVAGFAGVIFGHTHMPEVRWADGVLYLNPGSAGPIRGSKPVSLAVLEVTGGLMSPRIIPLL